LALQHLPARRPRRSRLLLAQRLITELLFRESDETGTIQLKAFYIRRILRIWPLYFLVFYGLVVLTQFVPWAGAKDPSAWLAFTFFAGNWWICLNGWVPVREADFPLVSIIEQRWLIAHHYFRLDAGR
jgi:peptidoglycan/LPS O-acetylase OafA/YrhL